LPFENSDQGYREFFSTRNNLVKVRGGAIVKNGLKLKGNEERENQTTEEYECKNMIPRTMLKISPELGEKIGKQC
jgi:hypothetical protein